MQQNSGLPKQKIDVSKKRKVAAVLSGGSIRGFAFHLGVLKAIEEAGFKLIGGTLNPGTKKDVDSNEISTYVGSSAGSIAATCLTAGLNLQDLQMMMSKSLGSTPRFSYRDFFSLAPQPQWYRSFFQQKVGSKNPLDLLKRFGVKFPQFTGIFSTQGVEHFLRTYILRSNAFQDYVADLFVLATQLNHSRKIVFGKYSQKPPPYDPTCRFNNNIPISQACAASCSIPVIFRPYPIRYPDGEDHYFIDGDVRDTLSTHVAVGAGADLIFASYSYQPYHYVPSVGSLTDRGLTAIILQSAFLLLEQKISKDIFYSRLHGEAIAAVNQFCTRNQVSEEMRTELSELLQKKLHFYPEIDTIYFHPPADLPLLSVKELFSLSVREQTKTLDGGYRHARAVLKQYEFV